MTTWHPVSEQFLMTSADIVDVITSCCSRAFCLDYLWMFCEWSWLMEWRGFLRNHLQTESLSSVLITGLHMSDCEHTVWTVPTGAGHEDPLCCVQAVGLLLYGRVQERGRGRRKHQTDLLLPLHSQIQHRGHPQCGAHSRYVEHSSPQNTSFHLPVVEMKRSVWWN